MAFTVKYNRTSYHIAGITEATKGSEFNYALSACAALSRTGSRMAVSGTYEDLEEALAVATKSADVRGVKMCKNCKTAAERMLAVAAYTLTVVRGEQPNAHGEEFGLAGVDVNDAVYAWFEAKGVRDDDPDVWVLVTPPGEYRGNLSDVIATRLTLPWKRA
jgi:hypothetical protein